MHNNKLQPPNSLFCNFLVTFSVFNCYQKWFIKLRGLNLSDVVNWHKSVAVNEEEQVMAIICNICKKEVELIRFGKGFVAVCCEKVLYNHEDESRFDMKPDEKKDIHMCSLH